MFAGLPRLGAMAKVVLFILVAALAAVAGLVACTEGKKPTPTAPSVGGMSMPSPSGGTRVPGVPPVKGYAEGQEVFFIHTEASDPKVAQMLSDMMASPVLVTPSLAQVSETLIANVYVFTNGIKGGGPFGFQPDVFDLPPGAAGYTPLRALNLVTWKEERSARVLKSAEEARAAEARGEVSISRPGVVINMPFLMWPGGSR